MANTNQTIILDRQIKFVDMILSVSERKETVENAIGLLNEIEQKHNLKIISSDFYTGDKDPDDKWCEEILFPFLSETHLVVTAGDLLPYCQIYNLEDYNVQGAETLFSWREWGHWMARWANKFWKPRPQGLGETYWTRKKRNWNYLDFYERGYLNYQVDNYNIWADTIIQIILNRKA